MLRPYLAVLGARYREVLQYRSAALANSVVQLFWGGIRLMVLAAFFASASTEPPMAFAAVVAYIWLGQAFFGLLPYSLDPDIQRKFLEGNVAWELLRPVNLYAFWYARTFAHRVADTTIRMLPLLFVALWVLPWVGLDAWALKPPPSLASGIAFAVALFGMAALATAVTMLFQTTLFWLVSGRGLQACMYGLISLLSGLAVPLPLLPAWLQPALYWQPFRGLGDTPFRIYSGDIAVSAAPVEIALQFGWTAVFVGIGYAVLSQGRGRLVIQGG